MLIIGREALKYCKLLKSEESSVLGLRTPVVNAELVK